MNEINRKLREKLRRATLGPKLEPEFAQPLLSPDEAVRLWQYAVAQQLDVVFGHYEVKQHSAFRNFGSWFTNRMTDWALDKPQGFYLSSFRCVSGFITKQVTHYGGPYPYLDGLLLQVTQRIGSITVRHDKRTAGESGYTFRRLLRLWLSAWMNFSLLTSSLMYLCPR